LRLAAPHRASIPTLCSLLRENGHEEDPRRVCRVGKEPPRCGGGGGGGGVVPSLRGPSLEGESAVRHNLEEDGKGVFN